MASAHESLYLDPQIRNWVLFPITIVMILVGVLRHYVTLLLNAPPKKQPLSAIREQNALLRSNVLRASSTNSPLPPSQYRAISSYLSQSFIEGKYLKDGPPDPNNPKSSTPVNPLTDPNAMEGMMDGMKKQMVMMVPQMVIMGWITYFFEGFVLIRLPFPLTMGFKSMMQRGVNTQDMDVRWVSSLSWYFLNLFGLNGLFRLLLGSDNAADSSQTMTSGGPMAAMIGGSGGASASGTNSMPQPGAPADYAKLFEAEKDNLEFAEGQYKWVGQDVERRVLERWGKIPASSSVKK
ncbi:transmembrane protein [Clavulina sp. PMI_390]|nr:transmembrane protein [Clavulina sp. PMI_390]